jgi:hypothetical protein
MAAQAPAAPAKKGPHAREGAEEDDQLALQAELLVRRQRIIAGVREYMSITFNDLRVAGAQQTAELATGLHYIALEEDDIAGWERTLEMFFAQHLPSAEALLSELHDQLRSAREAGDLSNDECEQMLADFYDPSRSYKDFREPFVQAVLPAEIRDRRTLRLQREAVLERARTARVEGMVSADVRQLDRFQRLSLAERRDRLRELDVCIEAQQAGVERETRVLQGYLQSQRCLSSQAHGTWLERALPALRAGQLAKWQRDVLDPAVQRAQAQCDRHAQLLGLLDRSSAALVRPLSASAFVALADGAREAHLQVLSAALEAARQAQLQAEAERRQWEWLLTQLERHLDGADLDGAQVFLEQVEAMDARDPRAVHLRVRLEQLQHQQLTERRQADARLALDVAIAKLPHTALRAPYQAALATGLTGFRAFRLQLERRLQAAATHERTSHEESVVVERALQQKQLSAAPSDSPQECSAADAGEYHEVVVSTRAELTDVLEERVAPASDEPVATEVGLVLTLSDGRPVPLDLQRRAAASHDWLEHNLQILAA